MSAESALMAPKPAPSAASSVSKEPSGSGSDSALRDSTRPADSSITSSAARSTQSRGPIEGFTHERLQELHRALVTPRIIEEKMLLLLRQGRLSKWFSGIGQEAIAVGVASALAPDDWILPMHRNLGVFTTRGVDLGRLFRQLFGKEGGFTKGRDRTFHFGSLEHRIVGMISHLGATIPVADGLALAAQLRGERRLAASFTGEGGTSEGDFHEAVNLAAVWKLPVLFVIENNAYGLSTPVAEQYACENLADRGVGYGIPGVVVDGNDLLAVYRAVVDAATRARAGEGPTLLEFKTFRMRGHEEASGTAYVPKHFFEEWALKDPIANFERLMIEQGVLTADQMEGIRAEIKGRVDALVEEALAAPDPSSTAERELADVYGSSWSRRPGPLPVDPDPPERVLAVDDTAGSPPALGVSGEAVSSPDTSPGTQRRPPRLPAEARLAPGRHSAALDSPPSAVSERRYVDAITEGLRAAMRRDPRIILLGQDIAEYGGVFKVTQGLMEEFGRERVRNTPIIESGALGAALGLALDGFVPMVEMQFGDFISCGFNQVVNHLAKTHYRWGASVPVVVRCPVGGGVGAGPFHSQNIEAWFTHVAGLKVVAPATPHDAKGLLLAAFQEGNPVLYLEHKFLYRSARGPVPGDDYAVPIGRAHVARSGRDATIVTYGVGVAWALEAAAKLAEDAREIEVVDLRSLQPWDRDTVIESVKKTSRVLVLHEAPVTGGFGGEVAASLAADAFEWLDAPVMRLGALDTPVPFSRNLEEIFSPKARVLEQLERLLAY